MTTYNIINKKTGEVLYSGEQYSQARQIARESIANDECVQVIVETQGNYENEYCVEIFNDKEILDF